MRDQLGGGAEGVGVRVAEDIGGGYHKAIVTFDNGNDIRVLIGARVDVVRVTIPKQ